MVLINIENVVLAGDIGVGLNLAHIATVLTEAKYKPGEFDSLIYYLDEPKTTTLVFENGRVASTGAKDIDEAFYAIKEVIEKVKDAANIREDDAPEPKIYIRDLVTSTDIGSELSLEAISLSLSPEKITYNPEKLPAVIYKANMFGNPTVRAALAEERRLKEKKSGKRSGASAGSRDGTYRGGAGADADIDDYDDAESNIIANRSTEPAALIFASGRIITTGGRSPEEVEHLLDDVVEDLRATGMIGG